MRIAVLTNTYPPSARGGAGRIAYTYTQALIAQGHEVRVWGPGKAFVKLATMNALSRFAFHQEDLKPKLGLVKDILAWEPEVLLTHNLTGCGFGTPRRIAIKGIPWFHVLHDVQLFEPSGRMMRSEPSLLRLRRAWRETWARSRSSAMGKPRGVISPTAWLFVQHKEHGLFKDVPFKIIPNPIELSFEPDAPVERDLQAVVFAGRMDTDKGAGVVYKAWPHMRDCVSKLVLIGEGSWRTRFASLKDSHIQVLGHQSSTEVAKHMLSAGMVVVPSLVEENQSTVALEALAAGCYVIASNVGGMKETLGDCGELVTPGSVKAFAEACVRHAGRPLDEKQRRRVSALCADHLPSLAASRLMDFVTSNL